MPSQPEHSLSTFTLISRPRWLWLIIAILCVASGLVYAFEGAVPRTVKGLALTRDGLKIFSVAAPQAGIIEEMLVKVGQQVRADEPVATLTMKILGVSIDAAGNRLSLLRSEDAFAHAAEESMISEVIGRRDSSIREALETIRSSTELLTLRRKLLEEQETLLDQGLVARETVLGTRTTVAGLQSSLETGRTAILAARLQASETESRTANSRAGRREAILQAETTLQHLEKQRSDNYTVRAVIPGIVIEVSASIGDSVEAGDGFIILRPDTDPNKALDVVAFIPQSKGKELKVGDTVQVVPSFVDKSRYGFIKGRLKSIDMYAATNQQLGLYIQSSGMIDDLLARYKSVLVGVVELETDSSTESGFAWSTRSGWPGTIEPGTILELQVVYAVDRPIELLLPWIRSLLGE
ncbi:MAG: NHLP bacteriocin system secretion protein [Phycisphaerales bacterium]|nr:NHLP bacteriocin system secretion protein [Phycisphaerales bacterium]